MGDAAADGVLEEANVADLARLGPARFQALVDSYAKTAAELAESVEQALVAADTNAVLQATHSLKGTSLTFGAKRVAALAETLERAAGSGDAAEMSRWSRELSDAVAAAITALRAAAQGA